jgi:hypothetical protein
MELTNRPDTTAFFDNAATLIEQARRYVGRTADLTMCVTYFELGRMIVEEEQGGQARAQYGRGLLKELSAYLNERFGRGFSVATLKNSRKFYQTYLSEIRQLPTDEFETPKGQTLFSFLENKQAAKIPVGAWQRLFI